MFDTDSTTRPDQLDDWLSLTAFQRDVLLAVACLGEDDPHYGMSIQNSLEDGYETVTASRLYTALDTVADHGLIWKTWKTNGPESGRRNQYHTTAAATEVLQWYSRRLDAALAPAGGSA